MMMNSRKQFARGFTLLEVLVAVLVLSFGLLGIAGLLLATVQNNTLATQRTTATFLAQDMADRIRQNINAVRKFEADGVTERPVYYINALATVPTNCYGPSPNGNCSDRAGGAARDVYDWVKQIEASLPAGSGIICQDLTPEDGVSAVNNGCDGLVGSPLVIKIFWVVRDEDRATNNAVAYVQRFAMMMGGT
jgi:type IV pilus assembly protein PilV